MSKWYDSDNPSTVVRGATWRAGVWIAVLLLFIGLIGVGVWGFKVATSDAKGRGDATMTKNSSTNRISAQERFEDLYADIKATDAKIGPAKQAVKTDPSTINTTNLAGLVNYCLDVVGDYNAEARKYTSADFRAIDLPAEINGFDTATDCK